MQELPSKLGCEFRFSLAMILLGLIGMYFAVRMESGRNLTGALVVVAAFGWRAYKRVREVRLYRFLQMNPEMARIYNRWSKD